MDIYSLENKATLSNVSNSFPKFNYKPVIIYYFVNPFCSRCWSIEPYIQKLVIEFGKFLTVRPIISHLYNYESTVMTNSTRLQVNSYDKLYTFLAIKAAALQGNKAHYDFLRNIQRNLFLSPMVDESMEQMVIKSAANANIDMDEFKRDLLSHSAKKAYQCDGKLQREMNVSQFPTLVFFSQHIEDYSLKISGIQSYGTYIHLLKQMIHHDIQPSSKPSMESFIEKNNIVSTKEIAIIYDTSIPIIESKLKRLQLMQKVNRITINQQHFWRTTNKEANHLTNTFSN